MLAAGCGSSSPVFLLFPAATDPLLHVRGHGTYVQDENILASVAGTLERVNKLVSVKPLRTKCVFLSLPRPSFLLSNSHSPLVGTAAKSEISLSAG